MSDIFRIKKNRSNKNGIKYLGDNDINQIHQVVVDKLVSHYVVLVYGYKLR
jgi:hypothetical protein